MEQLNRVILLLSKLTISSIDKDYAYITPTTLQTLVAHARRHPKDTIGWNALPKVVQDNFEACSAVVPETWKLTHNSKYIR
jgi:hypothetical protein